MNKSIVIEETYPQKPKLSNWYIFPGIVFLVCLMVIPLVLIFKESIWQDGFTFTFYQQLFSDTAYSKILLNTIRISSIVTACCFILAYPFALILYAHRRQKLSIVYLIFLIPLIINPLALLYAWMVILQKRGVLNFFLFDILHLTDYPLQLIYNAVGVIVPMTYLLLPYAIFLTYAALNSIDSNLIKSAYNLGATRMQVFQEILLPLSLPGSLSGALIVFILAMGYFVTPALLGGLEETMISMVIENRMNIPGGWGVAGALTFFLISSMIILFFIIIRLLAPHKLWKDYFSNRL